MSQIHVLADAGAPQLSAILAGVYGQYQAETNRFKVASEFYPISPLFGYFDRAGVPVTPDSVFKLEAPDGKEALMRAQLMLNLAQRWGGMYGSLLSSAGGLASTLAQVDAEMVSNGVRTHMLTSGWRAYTVPIRTTFETDCLTGTGDERELIASLGEGRRIGAIEICPDEVPVDFGSDIFSTGVHQNQAPDLQQVREGSAPAQDQAAPCAWAHYDASSGLIAKVAGTVLVCAQSPTGAVEAAKWVIGVQAQCPSIVKVPVTIVRVLETEEVKQEEAEAWSYPRD